MTRFWSGVAAATFLASVGVAAQNAPPPAGAAGAQGAQGRESSSSSQASSQQKITVTGCIQNAPSASATATTGGGAAGAGAAGGATAGATATAGQNFMLANAKMAGTGGAGAGAVGTSGTAATRYELDGEAKTISAHLNHQVEITGSLESSSASSAGAASSTAGSRAPAAPKLKVDSVKMVSATCQ